MSYLLTLLGLAVVILGILTIFSGSSPLQPGDGSTKEKIDALSDLDFLDDLQEGNQIALLFANTSNQNTLLERLYLVRLKVASAVIDIKIVHFLLIEISRKGDHRRITPDQQNKLSEAFKSADTLIRANPTRYTDIVKQKQATCRNLLASFGVSV